MERVEEFATLLDGNVVRSKIKDFRTALSQSVPNGGALFFLITNYVYKQLLFFFLYNGIKIIYGTKRGEYITLILIHKIKEVKK